MDVPHDAVLLRIFTSAGDRCGLEPLYLAIVMKARERHLAGATVLRGPLGFGQSTRLHQPHMLPHASDLPVVIEIVDAEDKIEAFLPVLDEMMESGLVTLEKAQVLQYGRKRSSYLERLKRSLFHGRGDAPKADERSDAAEQPDLPLIHGRGAGSAGSAARAVRPEARALEVALTHIGALLGRAVAILAAVVEDMGVEIDPDHDLARTMLPGGRRRRELHRLGLGGAQGGERQETREPARTEVAEDALHHGNPPTGLRTVS
jgi:PII-like signaling protein